MTVMKLACGNIKGKGESAVYPFPFYTFQRKPIHGFPMLSKKGESKSLPLAKR